MSNLTFNPGTRASKTLDVLADEHGLSKGQVIRNALLLAEWFESATADGGRVLVERDGEVREIIPWLPVPPPPEQQFKDWG